MKYKSEPSKFFRDLYITVSYEAIAALLTQKDKFEMAMFYQNNLKLLQMRNELTPQKKTGLKQFNQK